MATSVLNSIRDQPRGTTVFKAASSSSLLLPAWPALRTCKRKLEKAERLKLKAGSSEPALSLYSYRRGISSEANRFASGRDCRHASRCPDCPYVPNLASGTKPCSCRRFCIPRASNGRPPALDRRRLSPQPGTRWPHRHRMDGLLRQQAGTDGCRDPGSI